MVYMLVAVSYHRAAFIPAVYPHNMYRVSAKRVSRPHNGSDIEIMVEVFDSHLERETFTV
mgnify:CR=1 FL=1